ncbi:Lrp/AsnC family transcriptional regulator [Shimia marina]|uniref:Leucine-responsive regulatory protein n=1 Tax=Shimia marina TaxID=321267 RepID=A0A0P1FAL3_9RHOB|nr:Lrp/AsnC family transcriptional regulator [Shimia marina]CUH51439.1 Leucine-responsive regulatory protein [Shimia marina]SFD49152.1 transcriptional regulator, AsnC family [Shimia marina]
MDAIDLKIVRALQLDGRMKIGDLAEKVGLSPTPCARRLERLQNDGVITGYGARVDPRKIGLPVTIFVNVELEQQSAESVRDFERAVRAFEEVMECYLMTGSRDFLLRVVAADLEAFDAFLEHRLMRVKGVRNIGSHFALRALVRRDVLPAM